MKSSPLLAAGLIAGSLLALGAAARADDLPATATSEPHGPPMTGTLHTAPGGGLPITSFFDIFVELTVDGLNFFVDGFEFILPPHETEIAFTLTLDNGDQPLFLDSILTLDTQSPDQESTVQPGDIRFEPIPGFPRGEAIGPNGSVEVSLPEPGALLIIGSGLLAIGAARRATRRRK
jgi:hypothetical protein